MPEVLASGSVVLAHGPQEIATIKYLSSLQVAVVVDQDSDLAVASQLIELANNPARRNLLSINARDLAFDRHNIIDLREKIRSVISSCTKSSHILSSVAALESCSISLMDINKILRNGSNAEAFKHYIKKLQELDDLDTPLANIYAFNAFYAYRKLQDNKASL